MIFAWKRRVWEFFLFNINFRDVTERVLRPSKKIWQISVCDNATQKPVVQTESTHTATACLSNRCALENKAGVETHLL